MKRTCLPLVSRRGAGSQYIVLDTASGKMVEHGVVGHVQHAAVVLHGHATVEDAFTKHHRKRRGRRHGVQHCIRSSESARFLFGIKVCQVLWDHAVVLLRRSWGYWRRVTCCCRRRSRSRRVVLRNLLDFGRRGQNLRWIDARRSTHFWFLFRALLSWNIDGSSWLRLLSLRDIIWGDFEVVDEDVREVDSGRQLRRELHLIVNQEFEVVCAGRQVYNRRKGIFVFARSTVGLIRMLV